MTWPVLSWFWRISNLLMLPLTSQNNGRLTQIMWHLAKGLSSLLPLLHLSCHYPGLPHHQGLNRTHLLIPNLGQPFISVYLLPTVKTLRVILFFLCFPSLNESVAGFVMLMSGIVVLSGFLVCIRVQCLAPQSFIILPALFDCVCKYCCCAWLSWCSRTLVR